MRLSPLIESTIITMGLGPNQQLITYGYGSPLRKGGGSGAAAKRRRNSSRQYDIKDFYDGIEHWEIKTNLFGKKINYKNMIEYDEKQNIKIDMKDANVIYDDIYKVEVKSVKRREVLEESEVTDE